MQLYPSDVEILRSWLFSRKFTILHYKVHAYKQTSGWYFTLMRAKRIHLLSSDSREGFVFYNNDSGFLLRVAADFAHLQQFESEVDAA